MLRADWLTGWRVHRCRYIPPFSGWLETEVGGFPLIELLSFALVTPVQVSGWVSTPGKDVPWPPCPWAGQAGLQVLHCHNLIAYYHAWDAVPNKPVHFACAVLDWLDVPPGRLQGTTAWEVRHGRKGKRHHYSGLCRAITRQPPHCEYAGLAGCRANMDVLVSVGTNASYIYSIISIAYSRAKAGESACAVWAEMLQRRCPLRQAAHCPRPHLHSADAANPLNQHSPWLCQSTPCTVTSLRPARCSSPSSAWASTWRRRPRARRRRWAGGGAMSRFGPLKDAHRSASVSQAAAQWPWLMSRLN